MRRNSIFRLASMTKPVTVAAAMMLVEDGLISLASPVHRWLPELADRRVLRARDGAFDDTIAAERANFTLVSEARQKIKNIPAREATGMRKLKGSFVWYELMTTDEAAAAKFYGDVVGWSATDAGMPDIKYTLLGMGGDRVAGLMALPQPLRDKGVPPHWAGYVGVDDVDAESARATQAGGMMHHPPSDIPGVGRFSVVADPQGAVLSLFTPTGADAPPAVAQGTPGHVGWHELHAREWQSAFAYYEGLFGWTEGEAIDMGPMGTYQLFAQEGAVIGGMMTRTDVAQPFWLFYFNVKGIDAAADRVKASGGQVVNGPHEVPGGSWIVQCRDPQGGFFAMVSNPR